MQVATSRPFAAEIVHLGAVSAAAMLGLLALFLAAATPWGSGDLRLFLDAGHRLAAGLNPHTACFELGCYRGSILFSGLMSWLPSTPATYVAWGVASLLALGIALRGIATPLVVALLAPAVVIDLAAGNVTCFMVAAMIALLRWPGARSATLLGLLFVLTPKPTFVPLLLWAFVRIPAARRPLVVLGILGAATLLEPGYIGALAQANLVSGAFISPFVRLPAIVTWRSWAPARSSHSWPWGARACSASRRCSCPATGLPMSSPRSRWSRFLCLWKGDAGRPERTAPEP